MNLLAIATSVIGLAALMRFTGMVYQQSYLDILDASFLLNLGVLAVATYHVRLAGGSQTAVAYVSTTVALVSFAGIVIYHSYLQLKDREVAKCLLNKLRRCCIRHRDQQVTDGNEDVAERAHVQVVTCEVDQRIGVPVTFVELREPLLSNS